MPQTPTSTFTEIPYTKFQTFPEVGLTQVGSNFVVHLVATGETVTFIDHFQFDSATWSRTTIAGNTSPDSNHAPVAGIIHVTTSVGSPITINALSAGSDPDTADQLALLDVGAASGTASRNAGGAITYTPHSDRSGSDVFTYTITEGRGGTATRAPPVIVLTGDEDFTITIDGTSVSAPTSNYVIILNAQDATIAGGTGHSAVVFHGARSDYEIAHNIDGSFKITDTIAGRDGSDHLNAIEVLQFSNKTIFVESIDNANIARLYSAALGRAPD